VEEELEEEEEEEGIRICIQGERRFICARSGSVW
jgi:hypothetical protein